MPPKTVPTCRTCALQHQCALIVWAFISHVTSHRNRLSAASISSCTV